MNQPLDTIRKATLVNEQDEVIGEANILDAHRGKGLLHRAVSVFLFRKNKNKIELLMQQRAPQKIVGARQWANTICGNVYPGETYEACATRRLEQELGIRFFAKELYPQTKFRYQVQCNEEFSENEMDMIFAGWYDGQVIPNPEEAMETAWVPWEEVVNNETTKLEYAPWFTMMLADNSVRTVLTQFLKGKTA